MYIHMYNKKEEECFLHPYFIICYEFFFLAVPVVSILSLFKLVPVTFKLTGKASC